MGWEGLAPPNSLIPNVVEFESLSALFLVQDCKRELGIPKPELFLGFSYQSGHGIICGSQICCLNSIPEWGTARERGYLCVPYRAAKDGRTSL